jgi:hypothetical protein
MLVAERLRVEEARHSAYSGRGARKLGKLGSGLCRLVHRSGDLLPGIRIDAEAGSIGEQALGSLTTALDEELSQRLPMNQRGLLEESLVVLLNTDRLRILDGSRCQS